MQIPEGLLPQGWLLLADSAYAAVVIAALYLAPWQRFRQKHLLNVYLGAGVALMVLWRIGAAFADGPGIHFLGITTVTLMFGWELAVLSAGLALLGIALSTAGGWQTFAVNALVTGALPAVISYAVYRIIDRALPNHIFVYIFLAAFAGAGAAMALSNFAVIGVMTAAGIYPGEYIVREFLPAAPLTSLREAVLNGIVMTLLVFYRPQWVSTFDEERYIRGK
ncbi:MAG: energy-coupling factor ABC transporter permease [Gammaproteobacteria bacterium]|nr:MAG: energy-coupling factor ABC transporter permease [Gammaproteobacteria bacterium]